MAEPRFIKCFAAVDHVLTSREVEVLQLLAEGKSHKEVASILNIRTRTAETHRADVVRKLQLAQPMAAS